MRSATLGLFYFCKYAELAFLSVWTVLIVMEGVKTLQMLQRQAMVEQLTTTFVLVIVCMVFAVYNLAFNNLLINMRFYVKTKCKTYGLCTYDCLNLLFCSCCLHTLCRDRCFTLPTLFKWLVKTCVIGTTIYLIRQANSDWAQEREEEVDFGYVPTTEVSSLDTLLIVYVLQHPMFMVARIPIFIVYSLLTCCCDKGRNYPDDEEFKDRIISFDYVKYETDVH